MKPEDLQANANRFHELVVSWSTRVTNGLTALLQEAAQFLPVHRAQLAEGHVRLTPDECVDDDAGFMLRSTVVAQRFLTSDEDIQRLYRHRFNGSVELGCAFGDVLLVLAESQTVLRQSSLERGSSAITELGDIRKRFRRQQKQGRDAAAENGDDRPLDGEYASPRGIPALDDLLECRELLFRGQ